MRLPHKPAVLLLDAGNTLVFLDHDTVSRVLAQQGEEVSVDAIRAAEGPALRQYAQWMKRGTDHSDLWSAYVAEIVRRAGVPADRARALVEPLRAEHERFNLWRRVGDGVVPALQRLQRVGVRLGLVSNSEGRLLALLDHLDLSRHFEAILDSGVEDVSKPDPEIFERALARMGGVAASSAVYAGDVPEVDVTGATAAGLGAVLVDPFERFTGYEDAPRVRSVTELADAWAGDQPA